MLLVGGEAGAIGNEGGRIDRSSHSSRRDVLSEKERQKGRVSVRMETLVDGFVRAVTDCCRLHLGSQLPFEVVTCASLLCVGSDHPNGEGAEDCVYRQLSNVQSTPSSQTIKPS